MIGYVVPDTPSSQQGNRKGQTQNENECGNTVKDHSEVLLNSTIGIGENLRWILALLVLSLRDWC